LPAALRPELGLVVEQGTQSLEQRGVVERLLEEDGLSREGPLLENLGRVAGQAAQMEQQRRGESGEAATKARFDPSDLRAKAEEAAERAQREAGGGY